MPYFPGMLDSFYLALGKIAYAWALVENILDDCIATVFHDYNGKIYAYKQLAPVSLSNKLDCLKKALRKEPKLLSIQPEGLALIKRITELAKDRHEIIHSAFDKIKFEKLNPLRPVDVSLRINSFDFSKYDYDKDTLIFREINRNFDDFNLIGNKMMGLVQGLGLFSWRIIPSSPRP